MPGQQVGGVAAAGVDAGEQEHPAGDDGERAGERDAHAGVADDVAAEVHAGADRERPCGRNASPVSSAPVPRTSCR